MKTVVILCTVAAVLWILMFSAFTAEYVPFWQVMFFAVAILAGSAMLLDRKDIRTRFSFKPIYLLIGPASVVALYLIFYIGKLTATAILPFAESYVEPNQIHI